MITCVRCTFALSPGRVLSAAEAAPRSTHHPANKPHTSDQVVHIAGRLEIPQPTRSHRIRIDRRTVSQTVLVVGQTTDGREIDRVFLFCFVYLDMDTGGSLSTYLCTSWRYIVEIHKIATLY